MGSFPANIPELKDFNPLDLEEFRKQAYQTVDFIVDYYKNIESYPVLSQVKPGYIRTQLPESAPNKPEPFETILKDVQNVIIPGMTHWLSPNFFAYFPATVSSAAFLGEMLCTGFNSVGFNWLASPASTELESVVMDWLARLLKLPTSFMFSDTGGGVIHGTTSEAILCTLVASRDRALETICDENIAKLVVYGSDQTHSTLVKACKIAGILPRNVRVIPTSKEDNFALSSTNLRTTIEADVEAGLTPIYLCATVGTTSSNAVDPVGQLADVANGFGVWVHVDAAYAGSACICPEFRHFIDGIERVDSLSLSPHKWLLTYLDCSCLWVKQPILITKVLGCNPEFLKNKPTELNSVVDYKDWQVGYGRRFRALRLWFVFRSYGVANLQSHIRSDVRMAEMFEGFVKSDPRFEIVVPRQFALVCFRLTLSDEYEPELVELFNRDLLDRVNSGGKMYMTHTVIGGTYVLRFAVGSTATKEHHVSTAWNLIKETADMLVGEC
uniref:tyrosine decarboxylase n=1 Tax=Actaea racemosa TaxID=64040 RepID=D4NUX3_ACTRA|nr:L-tryptophan decarboxylase [Actaea racemosa]